jgi:hypothetical protein
VYGWIWRHLPFGRPGRIVGSLLLAVAAAAVLWFGVFPRVESYMPWNDGQITTTDGGDNVGPGGGLGPDDVQSTPPPGVIPYNQESNNPAPSASPTHHGRTPSHSPSPSRKG